MQKEAEDRMLITEQQYQQAIADRDKAQEVINQFHREAAERFDRRLAENPVFTDDELIYSRSALCPCGHGVAYPKACGPNHYWDCSAVLKGIADKSVAHTGQLSFAFYDIKGELDGETTRGVFRPKDPARKGSSS